MKIAIHQPRGSYFLGGAEVISIELAKYLANDEDVSFVTSKNSYTDNFRQFKENFSNIRFIEIKSPCMNDFKNYEKISAVDQESLVFNENSNDFYKNEMFDLIIGHYPTDILNLYEGGSRIILHLHGYPRQYKEIDNISYHKANSLIACSNHVIKKTRGFFSGLSNIYKFYHIPDLSNFKPMNLKKEIDVLYVGRLTKRKGISLLVDAIFRNHKDISSCVIAGDGPERKKLEEKVNYSGLGDKIKMIGKVQKNEVVVLMNKSKLFVHPTISREPFPTTLMESMAVGTPIVSTIIGGIPEMIKSGYNGLLVYPNIDDISDAIKYLLRNSTERERISINGLSEIENKYNQKRKSDEYCKLINDLSK